MSVQTLHDERRNMHAIDVAIHVMRDTCTNTSSVRTTSDMSGITIGRLRNYLTPQAFIQHKTPHNSVFFRRDDCYTVSMALLTGIVPTV
jgi:hypothetical protein